MRVRPVYDSCAIGSRYESGPCVTSARYAAHMVDSFTWPTAAGMRTLRAPCKCCCNVRILSTVIGGAFLKVTIREVASRAGVSPATVSRVLNKPELVEAETKERVREAMEALNFRPSAMARSLSIQRTHTIGLVVPGITDFFFSEVYAGIERASRERGMKVLLYDAQHDRHRALEAFGFLKQHGVDGIIFTSKLVTEDFDPLLMRLGLPVVLVLTQASGKTQLPAYKVDEVKAEFDAVSHLVSRGHRRIGMLAANVEDEVTGMQRYQGYRQAVAHYGLPFDESFVEFGNYRFMDGYTAMQRLLSRQQQNQLTAVVTVSDEMAVGAMRCLYDNGLQVPDDMSIVGFDNLRLAAMTTPRLTTVGQPFLDIGAKAVHHLMALIEEPQSTVQQQGIYFVPHHIVERESVRTILEAN